MSAAASFEAGLAVEVVTDPGALRALSPEWSRLCDRAPSAPPFMRPEWQLAWWDLFGTGDLRVITVRRARELVGLVPLSLRERTLELVGGGVSDYLDGVFDPSDERRAATAAMATIAALGPSCCVFDGLRRAAVLRRVDPPDGFRCEERVVAVAPLLDLARRAIPSGLEKRIAYERRRLAREGGSLSVADATTLDEGLEALFRLHGARWRSRGTSGVLSDPRVRALHRSVAPAWLARGILRLHLLRLGGALVGALHVFVDHARAYYYLGGFDPGAAARSPGVLLVAAAIDDAIACGASAFDFLRGAEPYKYAWGAVDRRVRRRVLTRP